MRNWELTKIRRLLLIALTGLLLTVGAAIAASYPFTGVVTADTNMRSTASSYESNIIRRIPQGDEVKVVGAKGNFYQIEYDGKTGYVFKKYVQKGTGTSLGTSDGLTATGYPYSTVTTGNVNLRKTASTSGKKLTTIPKGATVTVKQVSGSWVNVTYAGMTGWVSKSYVRLATISAATPTPTTAPTANPVESTTSYQLLQSGADGDQVMALQEALIELGYLRGTADGVYGSATAQAVMALQKANDYPITGYADANLQAFIFNGTPVNATGTKTSVKTLPALDGLNVRSGDKGLIVRTIQSKLIELGYLTGTVSGTYDSATVTAVKAFQNKNGLKADGVAGSATQTLLFGKGLSASATVSPTPTAEPTLPPPMETPKATVRSGSKGTDAALVQQRLIELKYLTGAADGKFGTKSVAALKAFQTKNGLTADGVAGAATYEVLFSYVALAADYVPIATPSTPATATATATPTEPPVTKENVVLVKQGVTGDAVLRLQKRLEELGYYTSARDSKCKADDTAAIRAFQDKNGLKVDGVAGYDTQSLLYSDAAIMYDGRLAGSLKVVTYTLLKKGMSGDAVTAMQNRLIELGYLTGTADGVYGTDTAEAVYYFQKANGLVRDSIAGVNTLERMFSTSAIAKATTPPTTPAPTAPAETITETLIKKGDSNTSVKAMQQTLINLGYLTGTADGIFGTQTYRALKEFQKANALTADGVAGSQTIAALNSANADSPDSAPSVTVPPDSNTTIVGGVAVSAENVKYEYWYSTVRSECKKYPYCTLYDPESGISWQVHMFSYGKHAEIEPLTAADTEKMNQVCGVEDWTPQVVWVIFADGTIRIATTHSVPHGVQHRTDNSFPGHACLHFPRTIGQVTAIGPYATKHQTAVDKAWAELQASLNEKN